MLAGEHILKLSCECQYQDVKCARIRVFFEPVFPVQGQFLRFCACTTRYGSEKICVLGCFT